MFSLFSKKFLKKVLTAKRVSAIMTTVRETNTLEKREVNQMTFIGYVVNGKPFGCGQRDKAYAYAKEIGAKVQVFRYKV